MKETDREQLALELWRERRQTMPIRWTILMRLDNAFSRIRNRKQPHCCRLLCFSKAEWTIVYGETPTPDDYTDTCTKHVGYMLDDSDIFTVYPIVDEETTCACSNDGACCGSEKEK